VIQTENIFTTKITKRTKRDVFFLEFIPFPWFSLWTSRASWPKRSRSLSFDRFLQRKDESANIKARTSIFSTRTDSRLFDQSIWKSGQVVNQK